MWFLRYVSKEPDKQIYRKTYRYTDHNTSPTYQGQNNKQTT